MTVILANVCKTLGLDNHTVNSIYDLLRLLPTLAWSS